MAKGRINLESFSERVRRLYELVNPCEICPRKCRVNRSQEQRGYCGIGENPKVSSIGPHFGEESVLVGSGGSGTIFFAGCNLKCIYCQNYDISHYCYGKEFCVEELACEMLELETNGCSNINFVTPTHVMHALAAAIELARTEGLTLPIVYNTGGYDSAETLELLEGLVEIYMPDMKYSDSTAAKQFSDAPNYWQINRAAVKEMHRQVGDLQVENRLARRGLLVRHLVLPDRLAGSFEIIDFLAKEISTRTCINVMDQYRPCYKADEYPRINRRPRREEIKEVVDYAKSKGLNVLG